MIRDTSASALMEMAPKINDRHEAILEVLQSNGDGMTDSEITYELGVYPNGNYVTPRRNELMHMGLVRDEGKRACRITGHTVYCWVAVTPRTSQAFKRVRARNP